MVGVPLHPIMLTDYMGLDAYRAWVSTLDTIARANDVAFWPTYDLALIPRTAGKTHSISTRTAPLYSASG